MDPSPPAEPTAPSPPPGPTEARARAPWLPLLVVVVAWLAHAPALRAGWVLDDRDLVRDGAVVARGIRGLPDAFRPGAWGGEVEPGAWRPLALASLAAEASVWRERDGTLEPFGFHLTNLFLHVLAAVLLLSLVVRWAPGRPWLQAGTALVFAVHPVHAGTIASLTGRADLLALVFLLLAARVGSGAVAGRAAALPAAGLAALLALLSRETAVGPLVVLALVGFLGARRAGVRPGARLGILAAAALPLVVWAVLRQDEAARVASIGDRLGLGLEGILRGVLAFVVPVGLLPSRIALPGGALPTANGLGAVGGALVVLLALSLLATARPGSRARLAGWALATYAAAALLASTFETGAGALETRALYLTGPSVFLLAGLAFEGVAGVVGRGVAVRAGFGILGAAALLLALGVLSWETEVRWRDDLHWHRALVEDAPLRVDLRMRLSTRLREEGSRRLEASAAYPSTDPAYDRLVRGARALLAESLQAALRAAELAPADAADPYYALGAARLANADAARARDAVLIGLQREEVEGRPWDAVPPSRRAAIGHAYALLGEAETALGDRAAAAERFERAARLRPDDFEVRWRAGLALLRAGAWTRCLAHLERALALAPTPAMRESAARALRDARQAVQEAADGLMLQGRDAEERTLYRDAFGAYDEARRIQPERLEAWLDCARLAGTWFGRYREALGYLDEADLLARRIGDPAAVDRVRALRQKIEAQREAEDRREREGEDDPGGDGDRDG